RLPERKEGATVRQLEEIRNDLERPQLSARVDDRLVAQRVLRCDLSLAEGCVRELPVPRAVADCIDVGHVRPAMLVRGNPCPPVDLDTRRLKTDALHQRRSTHGDEHEITLDRLALAEMDGERASAVVDLRALLSQLERDSALAELLRELLGGVFILHRDQPFE